MRHDQNPKIKIIQRCTSVAYPKCRMRISSTQFSPSDMVAMREFLISRRVDELGHCPTMMVGCRAHLRAALHCVPTLHRFVSAAWPTLGSVTCPVLDSTDPDRRALVRARFQIAQEEMMASQLCGSTRAKGSHHRRGPKTLGRPDSCTSVPSVFVSYSPSASQSGVQNSTSLSLRHLEFTIFDQRGPYNGVRSWMPVTDSRRYYYTYLSFIGCIGGCIHLPGNRQLASSRNPDRRRSHERQPNVPRSGALWIAYPKQTGV